MSAFNEIDWHDSIIKKMVIDRNSPGINDAIKFEMDWKSEGEGELLFEDVYWANFNLNFGIVAVESILNAYVSGIEDLNLKEVYSKWKGMLDDVYLNIYTINLNSSGGQIKIIAKAFKLTFNN